MTVTIIWISYIVPLPCYRNWFLVTDITVCWILNSTCLTFLKRNKNFCFTYFLVVSGSTVLKSSQLFLETSSISLHNLRKRHKKEEKCNVCSFSSQLTRNAFSWNVFLQDISICERKSSYIASVKRALVYLLNLFSWRCYYSKCQSFTQLCLYRRRSGWMPGAQPKRLNPLHGGQLTMCTWLAQIPLLLWCAGRTWYVPLSPNMRTMFLSHSAGWHSISPCEAQTELSAGRIQYNSNQLSKM